MQPLGALPQRDHARLTHSGVLRAHSWNPTVGDHRRALPPRSALAAGRDDDWPSLVSTTSSHLLVPPHHPPLDRHTSAPAAADLPSSSLTFD